MYWTIFVGFALLGLISALHMNVTLVHQLHSTGTQRRLMLPIMDSPKRPQFKIHQKCWFWVRPGRTSKWWDNFLAGDVVDEEWKLNFRMSGYLV